MADYSQTAGSAPVLAHPSTFAGILSEGASPGMAVCAGAGPDLTQLQKARADSASTAKCAGALRPHGGGAPGETAIVQYGDVLRLTTDQWDAVAGTTGGLVPNATYYVSAATAGHLTNTAPVSEGSFVSPVGYALSATEMLIGFSAPVAL